MVRRPTRYLAVAAAALALGLPPLASAAPAPAPGPLRETATKPVVSLTRYLADVEKATNALQRFGRSLGSISSITQFQSRLPYLRRQLRIFDTAIKRLATYRLANARANGQRGRLARLGPGLTRILGQFLDAVRDRDGARVTRLQGQVIAALNQFARAAQV